ncbi:MAG: tetratricopeptide repeat protein [Acidobacteriaceae bacterium]|nr:tetratricopeptide repeat protein [Acidobacteriaceae bacterium]
MNKHSRRKLINIIFSIALMPLLPSSLGAQCQPDNGVVQRAQDSHNPSSSQPQFFDQPTFTVAGVTDTANPAGHGSTVWRTSDVLAKQTASLGKINPSPATSTTPETEQSLREAAHQPGNFEANHLLGNMLLAEHKPREALPYLEVATQLKPDDYKNKYALALAYAESGDYQHSQTTARQLLAERDTAEAHHLLADDAENFGDSLTSVREYQRAAELDPSETNLFDWGAELLLHHAPEPASEVFAKGHHLFPNAARMLIGLGIAHYARGSSEQAATCLCQSSDLNPDDPNPYLFLGRLQEEELTSSEAEVDRFKRFASLQPENGLANYYYALALLKLPTTDTAADTSSKVESLLQKAVHLDPKLARGYLQLGILYSDRKEFSKAISAYQQAIDADPTLAAAHYRLAQDYRRTGDKQKAEQELKLFEKLSKEEASEAHREHRDLQQFVYTLRDQGSSGFPQ